MTDVAEETTAAAIWARLESLYMTKSLPRAFIKQLYSFRMVESKTIRDIDGVQEKLNDLENIKVNLEDEYKVILLLIFYLNP